MKKKSKYYEFLKVFISFLNSTEINYVLLKGIANELIIYGELYTRVYGDIDIMMSESNQEKLLKKLEASGFDFVINEYNDFYSHEMLISIKYGDESYLIEMKRRHRETLFDSTDYYLNNKKLIVWENMNIPVLNNEALLLSSSIYIYNYFERVAGWLFSKKIRFCYFLDLYNFIKKYNEVIDYESVINESITQGNTHKIILILQHLYKLFNDYLIFNIYNYFKEFFETNSYAHNDYFNVGRINWNISIQNRIFNYEDVAKIIEKYLYGSFFLNEELKIGKKECKIESSKYNINLYYDFMLHNNFLKIIFYDMNIPRNGEYVIYITLYCYDKYGDYIAQYLPISIRLLDNEVKVVNRFTADFSSGQYKFESETLMPYQNPDTIKIKC